MHKRYHRRKKCTPEWQQREDPPEQWSRERARRRCVHGRISDCLTTEGWPSRGRPVTASKSVAENGGAARFCCGGVAIVCWKFDWQRDVVGGGLHRSST